MNCAAIENVWTDVAAGDGGIGRKVYYNITVTTLSVAVALIIGTIELLGLLAAELGWTGGFWDWLNGLNLNTLGYFIVGLFVATWAFALLVWKFGRIEDRWSSQRSR
jgi:high-affinity nickel-transport protein